MTMHGSCAELYRQKLATAAEAVRLIPSGAKVVLPPAAGAPPAMLAALADRARAGGVTDLQLYYMLSAACAGGTVLAPDLMDHVTPMSFFHGSVERELDAFNRAHGKPAVPMLPCHFHQVPRAMVDAIGVDTLIATVSPMDERGNFSLGTNVDYTLGVARKPGIRIILEVNPDMPRTFGDCEIHVSDVMALVEHAAPLPCLGPTPRIATDDMIGAIIAGLVEDGACLQMGIGALPNAVCANLHGHRNLGIHTEMMTSGLADLMKAGVVDNSRKQTHVGRSVFTFALGDQSLYDFLHENPAMEARPVDYVNNPTIIARNDRVLSVNATLQIDLSGACNSEVVNGRQFSASGGQLDFVRGAYASNGGKSIIACHSTAARGSISRIAAQLTGPVTTPRNDTHIIVTEFGWLDLKGKSLAERAAGLIALAHPNFRDELGEDAHNSGLVPRRLFTTS
ncbi:acetyl-CoA hydrolase/transferase C-terminal domain-containing protein [Sphingobium sp. CR2-8]|uniref:acetyl-CoA hydrolase/transferase family protein n=1 Tax=Sphingobium sp. CR2-8 TaxID=1306534 RepID=UPI002DB70350|nr:acetyl-CoA hydrolase/transferase C-terminal domain-containing protein [Sphingobium sp. CR2-8]MEC3909443.1 acetyl-CoA hydrolase/transferase C-terminal domain-containing protein [Sphingobium sp. CR2-8]